jgi:hypothetical protein
MSGDSFTEWAVQYENGLQFVDDEDQASDWQQYLPQPNWVVSRTVTRGEWVRSGLSSGGDSE